MLDGKVFSKLKRDSITGFTLVELLIVIAIIGILVTIVVVAIDPARVIQNSNDTKKRAELTQLKTSMQLYFNENNRYPDSGEYGSSGTVPLVTTYIKKLPAGTYTPLGASTPYTNYEASVAIIRVTGEDSDSGVKCGKTAQTLGSTGNFWICPD